MAEILVETDFRGHEDLGFLDDREADTLDDLAAPIDQLLKLLTDQRNIHRLSSELYRAAHWSPKDIVEFLVRLDDIKAAAAAPNVHQGRTQKTGQLPDFKKIELLDIVERLARFSVGATGKHFSQNHSKDQWPERDGVEVPKDEKGGPYFVFRVVQPGMPEFLPWLRAVVREIDIDDVNPPLPGRPRGRRPKLRSSLA